MTHSQLSTRFISKVYRSIFYNQCYVCGFRKEGNLCSSCATFLHLNKYCCERCGRPTSSSIKLCGECQKSPPSFTQAIAPLQYKGLCRALISKAKFENQPHLLRPLVSQLADHILQQNHPIPTVWCSVPTTTSSLVERGFCQTQFISHLLLKQLRQHQPKLAITQLTLQRTQPRQAPQHTLHKKERHKLNAKHFHMPRTLSEPVLLIDDIITTGSTVNACAQAIILAGAPNVTVWALARTPE